MEEIIKTTLLEHEKSSFLLDLIKHTNGSLYINIKQTIHESKDVHLQSELKINPSILSELMEVLVNYKELIPKEQPKREKYLTEAKKKEIISRYLKGIPIKDLTIQFDCSATLIEQVLQNKRIAIIDKEELKPEGYRERKSRRFRYR